MFGFRSTIDCLEAHERFNRKLFKMCAELGFKCTQVNGQRICTSIKFHEKPSLKGTEIFIGRIPRNAFEDELIPLFMKAGELCQFRLMLDFSLKTRGFAFATYATVEAAQTAIDMFNNYEIRPNFHMGVFKSLDNCRLFFGNIPQTFNKADILKVLNENQIEGVSEIIMYKDLLKPNLNRGYVFVEFNTHRDAAMARKQLYPGCLIIGGQAVFVDWADPIPDVDPKVMENVTKLFIHDIPMDMQKNQLTSFMEQIIDMNTVLKVHKQKNYAFVHFKDRLSAEIALNALKDLPFPGMVVEWARPREYSKQLRLESAPTHFCLSLPPKMRRHYQEYLQTLLSDSSSSSNENIQKSSLQPTVKPRIIQEQRPANINNNKHSVPDSYQMNNYIQTQQQQQQQYSMDENCKMFKNLNIDSSKSNMNRFFQNQNFGPMPTSSPKQADYKNMEKEMRTPLVELPFSPIWNTMNTMMPRNELSSQQFYRGNSPYLNEKGCYQQGNNMAQILPSKRNTPSFFFEPNFNNLNNFNSEFLF